MATWKRIVFYGIGIGAGAVLVLGLAFVVGYWYLQRPKPWNDTDLTARLEVVRKLPTSPDSGEATPQPPPLFEIEDKSGFEFWYLLSNHSSEDYELSPNNVSIHAILKDSGALTFGQTSSDEPQVNFPIGEGATKQSIFIPAKSSARITVRLPGYATAKESLTLFPQKGEDYTSASPRVFAFVHSQAPNLGGFVLFDRTTRRKIDLPAEMVSNATIH